MALKPKVADAPGLEIIRSSKSGYYALWRAPRAAIADGYEPKSLRLEFDPAKPENHDAIRHLCRAQSDSMDQWYRTRKVRHLTVHTINDLVELYQIHEASPFKRVKFNTRKSYFHELRTIRDSIGPRLLSKIGATDFVRWHAGALNDDGTGQRKAQGIIKRLRAIISFGVVAEVAACQRLDQILSKMKFEIPKRRSQVLTYDMAVAIIAKAHELGRPSVALAQALQFETALRQANVVGLWAPHAEAGEGPFRTGKLTWASGLRWEDIDDDLVLTLETTKTGATVTHALGEMPLVKAEIDRIPRDRRFGPVIINETTSAPYLPLVFSRNWRKVADAAGVPKEIWNRDSRAGAISEGDEAGADLNQLQRMAGHTASKMTQRYVRGKSVETSKAVSALKAMRRGSQFSNLQKGH